MADFALSPGFNESVAAVTSSTTDVIATALNTYFVLASGIIVFSMQLGFALLTIGCVQAKSAKSICLKNILDASVGVLGYYLFGWAFAYGDNQTTTDDGTSVSVQNGFIGSTSFALHDVSSSSYHTWFFQYVFAISTATIVSGAVAERVTMTTYVFFAFFLTAWVYPVLSHWVWSTSGWASTTRTTGAVFLGTGVYDTVGSGAVHMVGGVAAFMGAWIAGPRLGRFDANKKPLPMTGHNLVFYMAGVLFLWFGFYGFNPGTMGYLVAADGSDFSGVVSRCVISTTMGGGFGAVTAVALKLLTSKLTTKHAVWCLEAAGNGALCGVIVITSGCAAFTPWAAALGGILGGLIYEPSAYLVLNILKVDDPTNATAVHGIAGAAGVIWYALMAEKDYVDLLYGSTYPDGSDRAYGWWRGDGPTLLWANIVWVFVIAGWTGFWMGAFFYLMKVCRLLRVSTEEEVAGMDVSHHGGRAYSLPDTHYFETQNPSAFKETSSGSGGSQDLESEVELLRTDMRSLTQRLQNLESGVKG